MIHRKKSGTCICAIKDSKGRIWIAADRRASWDFSKAQSMPRPKVTKRNGVILAGTGDGFLCHLIVDILDVPDVESDPDVYIHWKLRPAIFKLLQANGMVDKDKLLKIPSSCSAEIVVAVSNHCYIIDILNPEGESNNFHSGLISIDEVALPYTTGCGGEHAKGSIDTSKLLNITNNKQILTTAIKVAALNSPGCDDLIDIEKEDS